MLDLEIALFFSRLGMYLISPWMWKLKKKSLRMDLSMIDEVPQVNFCSNYFTSIKLL